jgi:hypothetical protein
MRPLSPSLFLSLSLHRTVCLRSGLTHRGIADYKPLCLGNRFASMPDIMMQASNPYMRSKLERQPVPGTAELSYVVHQLVM